VSKEQKSLLGAADRRRWNPTSVTGREDISWGSTPFLFGRGGVVGVIIFKVLGVQRMDAEELLAALEWVCCFSSGYEPDLGLTKCVFAAVNSCISLMLGWKSWQWDVCYLSICEAKRK